ncbi:MAG: hypothetical protein KKB51_17350 [Candidatus Riflebacteria bacterium]|nr:hypothetical protein [Candidatus Riflebacteria bacterium]
MKKQTISILVLGFVLGSLSGIVLADNAAIINAIMINQVQTAEAQRKAMAPAAVATTIGQTLGRAPTETEMRDGLNHLANGGSLQSLRGICVTSEEAQTKMSETIQNTTGAAATEADYRNATQHIMSGGTIEGYSNIVTKQGNTNVGPVNPQQRNFIWQTGIQKTIQMHENPAAGLGE